MLILIDECMINDAAEKFNEQSEEINKINQQKVFGTIQDQENEENKNEIIE